MNILWLSHLIPYPPKGGVLQRSYNLLKETARINKVWLVAFNQKALLPTQEKIADSRKALQEICEDVQVISIASDDSKLSWHELVIRSFFTRDPYTINWLKSDEMRMKIRRIVENVKFDVAHFDTISLAEYCKLVGDTPKVLNHHNIESAMMLRRAKKETNLIKKVYFYTEGKKLERYERKAARRFHLNLTVSGLDKETLSRSVSGSKIEVVPNGVDLEYFRPKATVGVRKRLIFVGGMKWYPNRDAVLFFFREVWPLLEHEYKDLTFTIIGRDPPKELKSMSHRRQNIEITGFVDDVRGYLDNAGIYICPIRDGGGTRLKILDAMAMGKPIVSTAIGCEGIDVRPEENILIANTPKEFVVQIKRIIEDHGLALKLGNFARKTVEEKYSWKLIGSKLNNCFLELTQNQIDSQP